MSVLTRHAARQEVDAGDGSRDTAGGVGRGGSRGGNEAAHGKDKDMELRPGKLIANTILPMDIYMQALVASSGTCTCAYTRPLCPVQAAMLLMLLLLVLVACVSSYVRIIVRVVYLATSWGVAVGASRPEGNSHRGGGEGWKRHTHHERGKGA